MHPFVNRMVYKYIFRDLHPLIFFSLLAASLLLLDIPMAARLLYKYIETGHAYTINPLTIFCIITCLHSVLFAMLFAMKANKELKR